MKLHASKNTPRSTAYLDAKAEGDNSMPSKRGILEDACGMALQDLNDMVRTTLFKSQFPAMKCHILRLQHLQLGATSTNSLLTGVRRRCRSQIQKLPAGGRWVMNPLKGTNEIPKSFYTRLAQIRHIKPRTAGWPKGRESYGHGASVVVAGVTTGQKKGTWESHVQGEGRQVSTMPAWGGTRDA